MVGHPGMADEPFAKRLAAWRAADLNTLTPPELAAVMTRVARERPHDPQAYRYLALAQGAAQDPAAAVRALRHAVELSPKDPGLWELLGEAELAAGDGSVNAEAEQAFRQTLALDPKAPAARFHLARLQIARGDKAEGLAAWRALLADLPASDPRRAELSAAIAQAAGRQAAPSAAPPAEQAMIQGMVEGLAQRLKTSPDDPEGWVRLVRAYAVLGDTAKRDATLEAARRRYANQAQVLAQLQAAAQAEQMR
jgi:cytochrome c-type biogenesis protein CcmH